MKSAADVEAKAALWLSRRQRPGWGKEDERKLARWIAEDRAHRIAMLRLSTVWDKADRLRVTATGLADDSAAVAASASAQPAAAALPLPSAAPPQRRTIQARAMRWLWPAAMAASLAILAVPLYQNFGQAQEYSTAIGGYQHIPLKDGSKIDLNTNSHVQVDYNAKNRRIALDRGEAYFTVAANKERPFVVETEAWRVIAVGTAFTVRAGGEAVEVLVTEGRVRIEPKGGAARVKPIFASAGQRVQIGSAKEVTEAAGAAVARMATVDGEKLDQALGWRDGLLTFEHRPLAEVAEEMNRYNHVQIVVDPSAADVRVDGSFRTTNAAGFVRLLEEGFAVQAVRNGDIITLMKKK